ncbi:MAG: methyltransferase [Gammaproteobacteria bacterium]|nr:methyltransferase [Gammaproteobacteria bacterium]
MSRRFQRWAARFPLTRPVTRRRTRELFDIAAGFVYSQVLAACVRLGLLERLADGPCSTDRLASLTGLPGDALQRLLAAAASLRLVEPRSGGRYGLGAHGAALLGNPGISAMVRHHALLYADLGDPVALLRDRRGARLATYWPYAAAAHPERLAAADVHDYSELMGESQALIAGDVLDRYSLRGQCSLLDLAGGEGRFAALAAARWPDLQVTLLDLPAVAERARQRLRRSGLQDRVSAVGGDLFAPPPLQGFDVVSLIRVVHDHDDAAALAILETARRALRPGGRLLIAEPMAGTPGAEPVGDAYFGLYLWAMGSGRARRREELQGLLACAGFRASRELRTPRPLLVRLLVAEA